MKQPKYAIRLLQVAEEDFKKIITYIALDNPSAARGIADRIENTLSKLSTHPLLGKIPDEEELAGMGYRYLIVQNYLIFYTVEHHIVWIHRIIHGARDYLNLLFNKEYLRKMSGVFVESRLTKSLEETRAEDLEREEAKISGHQRSKKK